MLKRTTALLLACAILAIAAGTPAAGEFTLRSRSLLQGPSRTGIFTGEGFILGTGGGIVVFHSLDDIEETTFLPIEGEPRDIALHGNAAYIASFRGGLVTVDLTDPMNPAATSSFTKLRRAIRCLIMGTTLFVLDSEHGLYEFDIDVPFEPQLVHTTKLTIPALWMAGRDDLIVVMASRKAVLYTIDAHGGVRTASTIHLSEDSKRCTIHGGILYTIATNGSVQRWSIEDPAEPGSLPPLPIGTIKDISFEGNRGLVLTKSNTIIPLSLATSSGKSRSDERTDDSAAELNVGSPLKLTGQDHLGDDPPKSGILRKITNTLLHGYFLGSSLIMDGSHLATIDGKNGVLFFSLDGNGARYIGHRATPGFAVDLFAAKGLLYVANAADGIRIGEVHDDGSIDWIGHLETIEARDLVVNGSIAALCDGRAGFKTIDVADPRNPRVLGTYKSPYFNSAIICRGDRAYIAGGLGGVEVLDIADAANPRFVWRDAFSEVRGIDVDDKYLYFADGYDGFRIFSIEQERPASISLLDTEGWNDDCFILDDYVYLADGGHGVKVVDVSDRANPAVVGSVDLGSLVRNVHAVAGIVFAAAHSGGVVAIDVSDPTNPFIAARHPIVDDARGVYVDDRFVYIAGGSGGAYIFAYQH